MDGHQYTALFEAPGGEPVLKVYPDPKTKGPPWTVGLGHTGPDVKEGETWTEERCWHAFYNDYSIAEGAAKHVIGASCWAQLSEPRRAVLTDMAFNMGEARLRNFRLMLDAIQYGQWERAKAEMLDSQYARDVGGRAIKNANVMLTGNWPEEAMV